MTENQEILFEHVPGRQGNIGLITLNRPQALNALSHTMIKALSQQLKYWQNDPSIKAVIIKANGDKAFCAGGDISAFYRAVKNEEAIPLPFFYDEYRLNRLIHNYPKPYVALMHGITMGGGVGISAHGSHRVACESYLFAMPETAIGFFPDVGGSYLLSQLAAEIGTYLGLTGARLKSHDASYIGLIDHCVEKSQLANIIDRLSQANLGSEPRKNVTEILNDFTVTPEDTWLKSEETLINRCFSYNTVEAIIHHLDQINNDFAQKTLLALSSKSPTSLKVTLRQLRNGSTYTFDQCMKMEYCLVQHFLQGHDFFEGIRAAIIDKDNKPRWQPNTLDAITENDVNSYFKHEQPELGFNDE